MNNSKVIYLKDYTVPAFLVDTIFLDFDLYDTETIVKSRVVYYRNPQSQGPNILELNAESLELLNIALDGKILTENEYTLTPERLTIENPPERFTLEIETRIHPETNTSLEGLYVSGGKYATQCEAQGFRRMTYYPDRPDVMAKFMTRITADTSKYPVLLSNGNLIDSWVFEDNRHFVVWEDPFRKPAYLFALVAGNLEYIEDHFTTMSGREVTLRIFTEHHHIPKCGFAMESLKRAMKWDEERYGLEYDLDIFMIVAVDDFNSGAMENKGLNIFNAALVFATPESATDRDYIYIERVIAHEYFHNWTGDRVTCRDWFQLSLKEGLTVYRDSEFTADMHSRSVKRIEDVRYLRDSQFREDASPMAHPIRPAFFEEIRNFYTVTVYEKGSEVVRMYETILGRDGFRKGMDLYFQRHDGQAVTTEDFLAAMADANERDLSQFSTWYNQAGTPIVDVSSSYDAEAKTYTLHFVQSCPPTSECQEKKPFIIPIKMGLISRSTGKDISPHNEKVEHTDTIILTEREETFIFSSVSEEVIPSLLRDFSAPVRLNYIYSHDEYAFLMAHDSDDFNRYEASQKFATEILLSALRKHSLEIPESFFQAFSAILSNATLDPSLKAETLMLPSEGYLFGLLGDHIDPVEIHMLRESFLLTLSERFRDQFQSVYTSLNVRRPYQVLARDIGERKLKNLCLHYLSYADENIVYEQFVTSNNMTDTFSALALLSNLDTSLRKKTIESFFETWKDDANVMNKWFSVQATSSLPSTLEALKELKNHPSFDMKNPNKVRSLYYGFAMSNPVCFHAVDGSGYQWVADGVLELDTFNSQVAGRLAKSLVNWRLLEPIRSDLLRKELERILQTEWLSPDTSEVVRKALEL